jgi:hypothetical protein
MRLPFISNVLLSLAMVAAGVAIATPVAAVPLLFDPGQELVLGIDAGLGDPFALRYLDTSGQGGALSVEFAPGSPLGPGELVQPGFVLLDGTLHVSTSAAEGRARARYQLRFDERALRRLGVRAADLRLMRRDARTNTWVRARRLILDAEARAGARFLFGRRALFELGTFGVDTDRGLVWGVMDVDGSYAIGAASRVSEPLSVVLVGSGLFGLGYVRRRRKTLRR